MLYRRFSRNITYEYDDDDDDDMRVVRATLMPDDRDNSFRGFRKRVAPPNALLYYYVKNISQWVFYPVYIYYTRFPLRPCALPGLRRGEGAKGVSCTRARRNILCGAT